MVFSAHIVYQCASMKEVLELSSGTRRKVPDSSILKHYTSPWLVYGSDHSYLSACPSSAPSGSPSSWDLWASLWGCYLGPFWGVESCPGGIQATYMEITGWILFVGNHSHSCGKSYFSSFIYNSTYSLLIATSSSPPLVFPLTLIYGSWADWCQPQLWAALETWTFCHGHLDALD